MRAIEQKDRAARAMFMGTNEKAQHVTFERPKNYGDVVKIEENLKSLRKRSSKDTQRSIPIPSNWKDGC